MHVVKFFSIKLGKEQSIKNRATSNLFNDNNYIVMKNNLKMVTVACCANSFLKMQSFQIYNGRVLELKVIVKKLLSDVLQ